MAHPFYSTAAWIKARHKAIARAGFRCQMCGADVRGKGRAHVDHIKPRKAYPELALEPSNLACCCQTCHNSAKQKHERNPNMKTIGPDGFPEGWG
jgi:uncharacterized protein (TIGR02646 family)